MTTQEKIQRLKGAGADIQKSVYVTDQSTEQSMEQVEATIMEKYLEEVTSFVRSLEFMRLGQAISHKQWQAAAMKANKLTKEIQRLGIIGFERPMTGVRQNVNRKNGEEALQALSLLINKRVKLLEILGVAK